MSILMHKTRRNYKPATGGYVFFRIKNKPRFILYVKIHAFCSLLGHILAIMTILYVNLRINDTV